MKNYKFQISIVYLVCLLMSSSSLTAQNLKVFIIAGQSNAQGHGEIEPGSVSGTLTHFMNTEDGEEFPYVQEADGSWATRDDVWVRYDDESQDVLAGILNVGFGASEEMIGPELGFGHQMGQRTDNQVLIIKTCWGGKNLAVDFRPPSSGGMTGEYYDQMISDVATAIDNISEEFPQYTDGEIEIAGMVWFQGWNDAEEQDYLDEYEQNLINLIKDVRTEWNTPDLPFVIGLTGNGGQELEPNGTWVNRLQTQVLPAQISAAVYEGHDNVSYVDTRPFWRDGVASPDPGALHHWHNNAESYLRIGNALGKKMNEVILQSEDGFNGIDENISVEGRIQANTNLALPAAYNFQEYVFPEPDDQGDCRGIENTTATMSDIFLSQTHRHAIGHPLLFTIGERPALLQIAVTGTGTAPDVQVEGIMDGESLGTLCLNGPAILNTSIDLTKPNFSDYFSVTLPKAWIKIGLELNVSAGDDRRTLTQDDLLITPYTELNLVEVDIDVMDYNTEPHRRPIYDDFLQELASAIPASVVRFGKFPETLRVPTFAFDNWQGTAVASADDMLEDNNANTGQVNLAANYLIDRMRHALGDSPNTIYFGNTLNLDPGGWGGNGSFVSFNYNGTFIHELGHALSLPHWGDDYRLTDPGPDQYAYPYGGELGEEAGGRGEAWNFIQAQYEFVSPTCQLDGEFSTPGIERSDCMQREFSCEEMRSDGPGPWDGFGDFSAKAMNNYLLGSVPTWGQVEDRGELIDFHLRENDGQPIASVVNGERVFTRHPSQPQNTFAEDFHKLPGKEQLEQDVYLIYGSVHSTMAEANIIYEPIKYKGTLLPSIDPTDPEMFAILQNLEFDDAPEIFFRSRDVTLKLTFVDGTVTHTLIPFSSFDRPENFPDETPRPAYFSTVVPADKLLCGVELYHRDFYMTDDPADDIRGNIKDPRQNITVENFMNDARLMAILDHSCNCPGTPDYVEPGTPCDDGNSLTINDVEDGSCNCAGEPIEPCDLVNNWQFEDNFDGWWTWGNDASIVNGEAVFENVDLNDAGIAQGPFSFNSGQCYTINFEAYASRSRMVEVVVYLDEEPYTEYYREAVDLGNAKQAYELTFNFDGASITNGAMLFDMKNDNASVFLDNVCIENSCGDDQAEIPYNGIDDDNDPTTLDDDLDQDGFDLADDCNDNDPNINLDQTEVPNNGIDDDCNEETLDADIIDVEIASCGLINNGQFEENLDSWWTWGSNASIINGEASLEDISDVDAGIAQGPLGFIAGDRYTIKFEAYAAVSRSIEVVIYLDEEPETEYYRQVVDLSSSKQNYELSFLFAGTSITNGALLFDLKNDAASIFLDNVCLNISSCGEEEIAYNGIDDDCDPTTLDDDLDEDGYALADDCDDTDANVNIYQMEIAYNGIDDDCDPTTLDDDLDEDGYALADDCDDTDANVNIYQMEIPYNGIDDDCDPTTLDDDLDEDGYVLADDCDDTDANVNIYQMEIPYNGIDDDCDPTTLDDDLDEDGYALADDCNDDDPNINPDQLEQPDNGVDEDCDASNDTTEEDNEGEDSNEDDEEEENNEEDNEDDDSTSEIAIGGRVQPNTNPALPSSYNFMEYVFPEPDDQGECMGIENATATISDIFLSQTHRHAIGHPLLFTIGERPALLQIAVTGTGAAPDVQVEGILNGNTLGTLCLNGPANLSENIDMETPNFSDYFSVTLPKAWIKQGLELKVSAGDVNRTLSQDDLKISSATEMNLVLVNIDMMDYNTEPHRTPIFDDFLEEVASAIPASVIRFGQFPETLRIPSVAATPYEEDTYVVDSDVLLEEYGLNTGDINGIGLNIMSGIQQSTGDFPNTIYFGNTLNLAPGGWGGDGSFVSFEYGDVFIHELGHALSLQHWGEGYYRAENPPADDFSYPYGGELGEESGGRGTAWNFIQADYEFVSPICEAAGEFSEVGTERSDCMQREFPCVETRSDGPGPWDGFGDYSVRAMSNFLTGSEREFGQVEDRGELIEFHLPENLGYPNVTLVNGERRFARTNYEAGNIYPEDRIKLPGSEEVEQDVYLIYGNAHATKMEANFIYEPIKYKGTLLPNIDPTDPTIFASLQSLTYEDAPYLVDQYRDITLKLTYLDGTEAYTLVPFRSFERPATGAPDEILSPTYFSVVVSGEKALCNVELYHREFMISSADNRDNGNINDPSQNITSQNFMSGAKLMGVLDHSCNCPGTPGYIEPGTACDDGNPLTENDVEDGNCNCAGVPILPCGVINNGKFTDGLGAWWQWGSDASSEDGEAVFRDIDEIDAGIAQGPFELIENETYTIAFDAYASEDGFVEVKVFLDEEPYTDYFSQQVELSTSKQSYTLSFQYGNGSADNVAMEFFLGGNNASIYLDNVCLSSACGTEEIAYNGIDDDCDPETLDDDLDKDGFVRASDCDDTDPGINPDADDIEGNAIDENCDGFLGQVLPASYLTFTGKPLDESVLLTWEVAKEVSVSHYIIERALESDTDQYEEIGEVEAEELSAYSFEDIYPQEGNNYYRIKSVDLNGDSSYTDVINVIFDLSSSADYSDFKLRRSVVVFPNPVLDRLNISAGELIQIIDASGRQFTPTQDVSGMLAGIYFAKIKIDNKLIVRKFIKQ